MYALTYAYFALLVKPERRVLSSIVGYRSRALNVFRQVVRRTDEDFVLRICWSSVTNESARGEFSSRYHPHFISL